MLTVEDRLLAAAKELYLNAAPLREDLVETDWDDLPESTVNTYLSTAARVISAAGVTFATTDDGEQVAALSDFDGPMPSPRRRARGA